MKLLLNGAVHTLDDGQPYATGLLIDRGQVIRTGDGKQYRLVELPDKFQEEGLGVVLDGMLHDDVLTKDMAGQAVDILEIR